MVRKRSFIIIEIMESINTQNMVKNAIIIINKQETLMRYIANINYYIINFFFSFLKFVIYYKTFEIKRIIVNFNDEKTKILKELDDKQITVLDNGLKLYNFFIPYEVIVKFGNFENNVYIQFLGKVEFDNERLSFSINKSKVELCFTLYDENKSNYLVRLIKINMFYHIKYNKVDTNLAQYYN
jgi:hypothetical protein